MYKILPWRFRAVFLLPRSRKKSGWQKVDQELDMGCQLLTRIFPCWNCRGQSCSSPLATPKFLDVRWGFEPQPVSVETNTCRKHFLRNQSLSKCMWGLHSHSREYRKIHLRNYFLKYVFAPSSFGHSGCIHTPPVPMHEQMFGIDGRMYSHPCEYKK